MKLLTKELRKKIPKKPEDTDLNFLGRVRTGVLNSVKKKELVRIDGTESVLSVHEKIIQLVKDLL